MGWFESQSTKEKKTTVKNAILVMLSDGVITPEENNFLEQICKRVGISKKEVDQIMKDLNKIKFTPAEDPQQRLYQLVDIVYMMMIDGYIDEREMDTCVTMAVQLGFAPSAVTDMVTEIVVKIKNCQQRNDVVVEMEEFLSAK